MNCPFCGHSESKVTDSRAWEGGVRRRRECLSCGRRFTTIERVELGGVHVVKKDGRREEFSRDKIIAGVRKACEKRAIPLGAIEELADEIETAVYALGKAEVPAAFIGELVMERLRELDQIAYIRFASVYRAFADMEDLKEELAALEAGWARPGVPKAQLALLPCSTGTDRWR
ncbi:MAG: transcriptional repressor NrdR [Chloroflexi bacterium]|nr:transcriptional repressor NrdR [Chloroflexota bacterium]